MGTRQQLDVFRYLDYRSYLRDYYRHRKTNGRGFSYRAFSLRAGLKSPNYLKLIIDGQRNLTPTMAERFADACGMNGESLAYFVQLVAFNQADRSKRQQHYSRLLSFRRYRKAHRLDVANAAYHSKWYLPAIRELIARDDFRRDADWIAKRLTFGVTAAEVTKAIDTLIELGLVKENEGGSLEQTNAIVSTGPETQRLHVVSYHREMMQRASEAMDLVGPTQRDISSLTLLMDEGSVPALKREIRHFRKRLLEIADEQSNPRQVVQVNFQLFPLSEGEDEK